MGNLMVTSLESGQKKKMPMSFGFYSNILKGKVAKKMNQSVQACSDADKRPFIKNFFKGYLAKKKQQTTEYFVTDNL